MHSLLAQQHAQATPRPARPAPARLARAAQRPSACCRTRLCAPHAPCRVVGLAARCVAIQPPAWPVPPSALAPAVAPACPPPPPPPRARPRRVVGLAARCVAIQPPACSFSGHNTPSCIAIQNPCCQPPLLQYNWAVAQSNFFFSFFIIIFFSNMLLEIPKNIYNHHFFPFPEHPNKFIKFYFLSFSSVLHLVKP